MFAGNRAPLGKHTWIWCGIGTVIGLSVCCAVLFLFAVLIAAGRIEESGWGWGSCLLRHLVVLFRARLLQRKTALFRSWQL